MKKFFYFIALAALTLTSCCGQKNDQTMTKDFLDLAKERYSVRQFADTPVPQDIIDKIIEAGKVAPTAVNSQPQKIYVVKSPEAMAKMNIASPCIYGAPQCFVFCYNDDTVNPRGDGNYGDIDVTIVLTHMMLEAANLGIGTCIVGYYDTDVLVKELNLPANIHPVLVMPFGYAAENAVPSPQHTSYRPLEETIEYL